MTDRPDASQDTDESTASDDAKGTSEQEAQTYTPEEIASLVKGASDAKAESGRLTKANETLTKANEGLTTQVSDIEAKINQMLDHQDQAEAQAAQDKPDMLKVIDDRRTLRNRIADADKRERAVQAREQAVAASEATAAQLTKESNAAEIASRYTGVDAEQLTNLTDGSKEKMEDLAKLLGTRVTVEEEGEGIQVETKAQTIVSGETAEGDKKGKGLRPIATKTSVTKGAGLTLEQAEASYGAGKITREQMDEYYTKHAIP